MSYEFKVLPFGVMNALEFNAENLKTLEYFTFLKPYHNCISETKASLADWAFHHHLGKILMMKQLCIVVDFTFLPHNNPVRLWTIMRSINQRHCEQCMKHQLVFRLIRP